ncbi:MAG: carotenoid biosynthesis protein [Candidatus Lokiarchaeota archaeon]|nr:carotenoid biosynthesis protein [Candidatus Lokiarchaeota archaeon]
MNKIKSIISKWKFQTMIVSIFFTVGIIGHYWDYTYPLMVVLTPFVIFISGIWAIYKCLKKIYLVIWIILAYIVTFSLEVLGVSLGVIFGPYYYGDVLGPKLFNVPVIIGLNWVFIILSLVLLSEWLVNRLFKSRFKPWIKAFLTAVFTATLATIFDFLMEPAAVGLNYWFWTLTAEPLNVPIQNYIAWFIISFSFALTLLSIPKNERIMLQESPHSPWFVLIQAIFFIAISIILLVS